MVGSARFLVLYYQNLAAATLFAIPCVSLDSLLAPGAVFLGYEEWAYRFQKTLDFYRVIPSQASQAGSRPHHKRPQASVAATLLRLSDSADVVSWSSQGGIG